MKFEDHHFKIRNEVRSLTSFRFAAALYVFLFHVHSRAPIFDDGLTAGFIAEGAVGMTMFFSLSGFILSHAYETVKLDLREYFWNRFARIYPVYLVAAVLALPWLAKGIFAEFEATSLIYASLSGFILLLFGGLLIQAWLPQSFAFWNNSASWSISCEAFFYALFPFLSTIFKNVSLRALLSAFALLCLVSTLIPVSEIVFSASPDSFPLYYAMPIFRLPEFVAGILAYRIMLSVQYGTREKLILFGIVMAGITHVTLLGPVLPGFTLNNWIVIPAVSAILVLLYKAETNGSLFWGNSLFVWLGQISYCFYSFQFHVLEGLKWALPPAQIGNATYAGLSLVILLGVSAFAHHFIEEPARLWIRRRTKKEVAIGVAQ